MHPCIHACNVRSMAETDLIRMPAVLRTNQAAADVIRDAILDGRLPMGRRLLETELAAELGIIGSL